MTASLILASSSPRRQRLLIEAGFEHLALAPGVDDAELLPGVASSRAWVTALAYLKARAGQAKLDSRSAQPTIIGADTIVVKGNRFIGQPRDENDARCMLELLEQGSHEVVTGVAILSGRQRQLIWDVARVTVGQLGGQRIRAYLESGSWRGKAGAYNLSERLEDGWPIEYQGDPTTIMGLPMRRLGPVLAHFLQQHHAD